MKRSERARLSTICRLLLLGAVSLCAVGAALCNPRPSARAASPTTGFAGCGPVDDSGSNFLEANGFAPSDPGPTFQRAEALKELAWLLAADSPPGRALLGVAFFGGKVIRTPLFPVTAVGGRQALTDQVDRLVRIDLGWTRVTAGIESCADALRPVPSTQQRFILVLSDFVAQDNDPAYSFGAQEQDIKHRLVPELKRERIKVFAIGYGQAVQQPSQFRRLMGELTVPTGGEAIVVAPGENMVLATGMVMADLAHLQSHSGPVHHGLNGQLTVDQVVVPRDVAKLILTIEHSNDPSAAATVITPDGLRITPTTSGRAWLHSATFDQLPISHPKAGTWRVEIQGQGFLRVDQLFQRSSTPPRPVLTHTAATPTRTPARVVTIPTGNTGRGESSSDQRASWMLLGGAASLLAVALAVLYAAYGSRRRRAVPAMAGWLTVKPPSGEEHQHSLDGKAKVLAGASEGCDIVLPDDAGVARLEFLAVASSSGRRQASVHVLAGEALCDGAPVADGKVLTSGSVLKVGEDTRIVYTNVRESLGRLALDGRSNTRQ